MSRSIDTRLARIEKEIDTADAGGISYLDALRIMRDRFRAVVASADASPDDRNDAADKLANLDAEIWEDPRARHDDLKPRLNIVAAIEALDHKDALCAALQRTVHPKNGDKPTPEWASIAEGMGLRLNDKDRVYIIERTIVSPPTRDIHGRIIGEGDNVVALH